MSEPQSRKLFRVQAEQLTDHHYGTVYDEFVFVIASSADAVVQRFWPEGGLPSDLVIECLASQDDHLLITRW